MTDDRERPGEDLPPEPEAAMDDAVVPADPGTADDAGAARERADAGELVPPAPQPRRRRLFAELRSILLPFVPGAAIMVGAYLLWQDAANKQGMAMSELSASEAAAACASIERALDRRADAIERLAATRAGGDTAWRAAAAALVAADAPLLAVAEVDSALELRAVVPASARLLSPLDPRDDATRRAALQLVAGRPGPGATIVSTVELTTGAREVLVCAPPPDGDPRTGLLVGVLDERTVLDEALARSYRRGFSAAVRELPIRVYGADFAGSGPGAEFARDDTVVRGPLVWSVQVWPAEDLAKELLSRGPLALFLTGIALAFVTSLLVFVLRERRGG